MYHFSPESDSDAPKKYEGQSVECNTKKFSFEQFL